MKAELELMQGEREESAIDLEKVRNLLEICTGLLNVQFHLFNVASLVEYLIMPKCVLYHSLIHLIFFFYCCFFRFLRKGEKGRG